jgi:hypothetical protein
MARRRKRVIPELVRRDLPWCPHCDLRDADGVVAHGYDCPITKDVTALDARGLSDEEQRAAARVLNDWSVELLCRVHVIDRRQ